LAARKVACTDFIAAFLSARALAIHWAFVSACALALRTTRNRLTATVLMHYLSAGIPQMDGAKVPAGRSVALLPSDLEL